MHNIAVRDLLDVSCAPDVESLKTRLIAFAQRLDFAMVSAVLINGGINSPNFQGRSISNTPEPFIEISRSLDTARRDPVMQCLMRQDLPFIYDQRTYAEAGAGDLWEMQAPYGYSTGIAVAMHLSKDKYFLLGVDRPSKLPRKDEALTALLDNVQTLAVHAQAAAQRLIGDDLLSPRPKPKLTPQELECLRWSMDGRSAWHVAQLMNISPRTVNFHIQSSLKKLGVATKMQAVITCLELGLI